MKKCAVLLLCGWALTAGAAVHLVGGNGTAANTIPFWHYPASYPEMRWQTLWLKSELNEAGRVTKIEWNVASLGITSTNTFTACKILLCHTNVATLGSNFAANYGGNTPVVIFNGTFTVNPAAANSWYTISAPTAVFNYNNAANLLIEVSWTGSAASGNGRSEFNATATGGPGRVFADSATAATGTVAIGYWHRARITILDTAVTPKSLGRVKVLFS